MTDGLIIDDNRQTADALQQMLELLDLPAKVAYGSSQAMAVLANFVPRFICLDINMPGVDGTEVLAYIRREPRLMKVPVIVITSDDQPETRSMF
jgi:chemosensory pili system protein ChpA (sensor histidine kinase/response regulator)